MSEPLDEAVAAFGAVLGELVRREVKAQLDAMPAGLDTAAVDTRIAVAIAGFAESIRSSLLVDGPAKPPPDPQGG